MDRETAKREIKSRYADYLKLAPKIVSGKPTYICPLPNCGNGTGKDGTGMMIDPHGDGTQLHCFKCGFHGDIISLYMAEHGCDFKEAFNALCDRFGIIIDGKAEPVQRKAPEPQQRAQRVQEHINAADFKNYYEDCRKQIEQPEAQAYLKARNISTAIIDKFNIGYDIKIKRVIVPATNSFYLARDITGKQEPKYKNPKKDDGAIMALFNEAALYNEDRKPVFITEGVFDALSFIEIGAEAVALNSAGNYKLLLQQLKERKTKNVLILSLDNDSIGTTDTEPLAAGLRELNIPYVIENVCGQYKDANEALTANRSAFTAAVHSAERKTSKPDNVFDYLRSSFVAEATKLLEQANRKTGFTNLDKEAGSIYAGLYVVGGISSVGKTTFISQLADQMAAAGEHVLFFSMEQSRLEMVSKSLARRTAMLDVPTALTSLQIRTGQGQHSNNLAEAVRGYQKDIADRLSIIEGNFDSTVSYIKDYVQQYIEKNSVKPVVIVDYLQVMQAEKDPETGRKPTDPKQVTDYNITQLKRMSRALEIPVIVVSSVNRSNYLTPIDFESFKESGGIEYTADVVWGLQLAVIHEDIFNGDPKTKVKEKRERVAAAKEAMPRDIELVCLKNRYGKSRYSVQFTYYPQFDYYMPK